MALGGADVTQWAVRGSLHKVLNDACNAVVRSPIKIFWECDVTKWLARSSLHRVLGSECNAAGCQMHLLKMFWMANVML